MSGIQANTGIGWYLTKDGKIKTGTNRPDGLWMSRKGWTHIGNEEFGPGGSPIEPLTRLAVRHAGKEIGETIKQRLEEAKANVEQSRIDRETEADRLKEEAVAKEVAATGRIVAEVIKQAGLSPDAGEPKTPKRKPGRPRKVEAEAETDSEE